jgi:hypothetical protein
MPDGTVTSAPLKGIRERYIELTMMLPNMNGTIGTSLMKPDLMATNGDPSTSITNNRL